LLLNYSRQKHTLYMVRVRTVCKRATIAPCLLASIGVRSLYTGSCTVRVLPVPVPVHLPCACVYTCTCACTCTCTCSPVPVDHAVDVHHRCDSSQGSSKASAFTMNHHGFSALGWSTRRMQLAGACSFTECTAASPGSAGGACSCTGQRRELQLAPVKARPRDAQGMHGC